jgi:hypothetical protein
MFSAPAIYKILYADSPRCSNFDESSRLCEYLSVPRPMASTFISTARRWGRKSLEWMVVRTCLVRDEGRIRIHDERSAYLNNFSDE